VLAVAVVALLLAMLYPLRTLVDQRAQIASLQDRERELRAGTAQLDREIARYNDPAYLERVARLCLGMVKPGEVAFVVVPKGGKAAQNPC
jgi:cell division protein FtsB